MSTMISNFVIIWGPISKCHKWIVRSKRPWEWGQTKHSVWESSCVKTGNNRPRSTTGQSLVLFWVKKSYNTLWVRLINFSKIVIGHNWLHTGLFSFFGGGESVIINLNIWWRWGSRVVALRYLKISSILLKSCGDGQRTCTSTFRAENVYHKYLQRHMGHLIMKK